MVRTIIQLSKDENAKVQRLAQKKGLSRAEIVRQAIRLLPDSAEKPNRHWGLFKGMSGDLRKNYRDDDRE